MFSSAKYEFQPRNNIQLILVTTARSQTICSATCNQQPACHTFDYDSASGRCRIFEADQTTGSIIASSSPTSIVGTVLTSPSQFLHTHNQSCEACQEDRYEYCSANGSTCQCRPHTFWNGSMCLLQLFENDSCSQIDACRSDINLTCATEYGQFSVCTSGFTSLTSTIITTVMTTTHISIFTAITTAATGIASATNKITTTITTAATGITSATNKITTAITTTATEITSATNKITAAITTTATEITTAIATIMTTEKNVADTEITTSTNKITAAITTAATGITSATNKNTAAITTTGITSVTNKNTAAITTTATNKITAAITTTAINKITTATITTIIQPNITTVAGSYNGSCAPLSGGLTTLHTQAGVAVSNNGILYVADYSPIDAVIAFEPNNLTGEQIITFDNWPAYIFIDAVTSSIYVTVFHSDLVLIWPSNLTIPRNASSSGCYMTQLYQPTGIIMDSLGNFYISVYACSWVTKWSPNATIATLVAGSPSGVAGSDSQHLDKPYGLSIDESNSLLYVVDRDNHRVQKFLLGNLTGVTVVGGNGAGAASNQLNYPTALFISQRDHSYYICDGGNNRIQKWGMNATYGITIAGSSTGVAGSALNLLNQPYDIWVHPNETYMVISDSNNCRVQKYILY